MGSSSGHTEVEQLRRTGPGCVPRCFCPAHTLFSRPRRRTMPRLLRRPPLAWRVEEEDRLEQGVISKGHGLPVWVNLHRLRRPTQAGQQALEVVVNDAIDSAGLVAMSESRAWVPVALLPRPQRAASRNACRWLGPSPRLHRGSCSRLGALTATLTITSVQKCSSRPAGSGARFATGGRARPSSSLPSPTLPRAGHGSHPCQGLYCTPAGVHPTTALIATHYNVDFSEHYLAGHLAERGYGFLGWNTRYRGNEAYFLLEHAVTDIGVGVRWLRDHGVETVVMLGNSGGGSLMGAYQSQALDPCARQACPMRPTSSADLYVSLTPTSAGPRCSPRGSTRRSPTRPTRSRSTRRSTCSTRPTARRTRPSSSSATAPRRWPATTGSPPGPRPSSSGYRGRRRDTAVHRAPGVGRSCGSPTSPSTRATARRAATPGDPKRANYRPARHRPDEHAAARGCRCGACRSRSARARRTSPASPCRRCSCSPRATPGIFPSDAQAILDAMGAEDKTLEFIPGDHYFAATVAATTSPT